MKNKVYNGSINIRFFFLYIFSIIVFQIIIFSIKTKILLYQTIYLGTNNSTRVPRVSTNPMVGLAETLEKFNGTKLFGYSTMGPISVPKGLG